MIRSMSYPKILTLLTGLACAGVATAQSQEIFAYVFNPRGKIGVKAAAAYKYEVVNGVYQDLLRAKGNFGMQPPELVLTSGDQNVAYMDPKNIRIAIEEKAYDVCVSFGADSLNALAALLGHELTHYFEKHDWAQSFVNDNKELDAARRIGQLDEKIRQETQADYLGGFLALSAGYKVYGMLPRLLKAIYTNYGLTEKLPGYPALDERVQISVNAAEKLKELQVVFETAGYLTLLQNYESAADYYRFILRDFQSREIHSNAGVNLAMAALDLFSMTEMPYILPLEPDPESRLYNLKGMQADRIKMREELMKEALDQFERAIALDPDYLPGYLNMACVYVMQGEWADAGYWLSKGKKANEGQDLPDFLALKGVMSALQKDSVQAEAQLTSAREKGSISAAINLETLSGKPRQRPKTAGEIAREKIDDVSIDVFMLNPGVDKEVKVQPKITCGVKQFPGSKVWVHYVDDSHYTVAQVCGQGCSDMTRQGIHVGSDSGEVRNLYGAPPRIVAGGKRAFWVYPDLHLLFQLDEKGLVSAWGAYRKSPE